jgi:hypothetical protein
LEKGLSFLESAGLDGVLVNADKEVFITRNLKEKVEILDKAYQTAE